MSAQRWRTVSLVLAGALVAALVGLVVVARDDDGAPAPTSTASGAADDAGVLLRAEADAEKAARAAAVHLTSYDYATLDTDFSWAADAGTERFQTEYARISAPIKKVVAQLKVHAVGSVDDAAATAQDADHVTVLLFVDQTLTREGSDERQLQTPRVTMSMVRDGDRWLVDEVAQRNQVEAQ